MKKQFIRKDNQQVEKKILDTLTLYFKGQFIMILINTSIFWLFLYFFQVKYAFFLGVLTGALSVVPTLGILSSALLSFLVSVFDQQQIFSIHPVLEGIILLLIYVILNQIVDFIISPLVIGSTVKVSPVILFLSVILGTLLFGIIGTFLAVPTVLVLKVLYESKKK